MRRRKGGRRIRKNKKEREEEEGEEKKRRKGGRRQTREGRRGGSSIRRLRALSGVRAFRKAPCCSQDDGAGLTLLCPRAGRCRTARTAALPPQPSWREA